MANEPSSAKLLAIIRTQAEIARLGVDLSGVMSIVADQARNLTGAAGAVVELAEGDEMVYRATAGSVRDSLGMRLQRRGSLSGLCVERGIVLRCDDSESDPRVDREASRRVGLRSMVVVPLIHFDKPVGVLKVLSPQPAAFSDEDALTLGLMAELISAAMFHAARYGADELFRQATTDPSPGWPTARCFSIACATASRGLGAKRSRWRSS